MYEISTEPKRLDLDMIHGFLSTCYWAEGIPRALVEKSIRGALCFGAYEQATGKQVGFARVISDYATFAYLADVFVLPEHRGRGVSRRIMEAILKDPRLQGLRRWLLATRDAHGLYQKFGFRAPDKPERLLEIRVPNPYGAKPG